MEVWIALFLRLLVVAKASFPTISPHCVEPVLIFLKQKNRRFKFRSSTKQKHPRGVSLLGAGSRTRTYEAERREIYSLLWLPLHDSSMDPHVCRQIDFVTKPWSRFTDSNRRPAVYKTAALTSWAKAAKIKMWNVRLMLSHIQSAD